MMKKSVFLFMLMVFAWMGIVAQTTTTITLNLDSSDPVGDTWAYRNVANYADLKVGDVLKATFELTDYTNHQLYIAGPNGQDKIVDFTSVANQTSYTHTLTESDMKILSRGMTVGYVGLNNFKLVAERNGSSSGSEAGGGSGSDSGSGSGSTTESYAPANPLVKVSDNLPKYIANWYGEDNVYRLKISNASDYKGKVLRVVCSGTGYDAYAFLKQGASWASIMSGADKFSIAGWKYFEITINTQLAEYLSSESGLIIGGNNYTIQAAYIYDGGKSASDWMDGDVVNSLVLDVDGTSDWATYGVPGSFFEYKYENNQKTDKKIANTKNNIIRLVLSDAGEGAQVSAKDNVENTDVAYLRERKFKWDESTSSNKYWYTDYMDCPNAENVDFGLSDAITVFKDYQTPVVDATDRKAGVKKGMLSTLLVNGMSVGCKDAKITKVEILASQTSKYITGLAVHTHKLSGKYWKPISLPYNLTQEQFKSAFGYNAVFCELGKADVIKTESKKENKKIFGMRIHFQKVKDDLKANYPYIINLCDNTDDAQREFVIKDVKADVRDFQTYVFRTPDFDCSDNSLSSEEQAEYKEKTKGAYMNFISTAPVFDIQNDGVGDVEIYKKTDLYTELKPAASDTWYNYAFSSGKLYPVPTDGIFVNSSLAYIQFSSNAKGLIDGTGIASELSAAKSFFVIDNDNETTGIADVDVDINDNIQVQSRKGIYNMNGQLVRRGHSVEGLAKGLYIVDGKKIMVK